MVVGVWSGCGGDSPTGPQGQTLEVKTEEWDNGNIKVEFQYYRDGGLVVKHGRYKGYDETGNLIDEDIYREGSCVESCDWRKTFGDGWGHSVQQTVDGGFIVTGFDRVFVLLLKTDGQGIEQWRKTFGDGWGHSVQQTVDGGFVVTGNDGNSDLLLLKTDGQGIEQWRQTFGDGYGHSVQQTVDGGFIVTGEKDNGSNVSLLKTDGQGNEEWRKTLKDGWFGSVQQTVDGGFIVTGRDDGGLLLLKTDELGTI